MSVRALAWSSNSGSVGWGLRRMPDVRRPEVISGADFVLEWNDSRQVLKKHQRQLFSLCEYSNLFETVLGQVGTSTPPTHGPLDSIIKILTRFGVTWLARNLNEVSVKPYLMHNFDKIWFFYFWENYQTSPQVHCVLAWIRTRLYSLDGLGNLDFSYFWTQNSMFWDMSLYYIGDYLDFS